MNRTPKVAVVGAGPSGLISAKYALQYGFSCDVFEQTGSLGGNWVYSDCIEIDESGIEVQSSIYKDMKSNVPKELMEFPDFKYPKSVTKSYIKHDCILKYHQKFAEYFNITKVIQYYTTVKQITPTGEKWIVTVQKDNAEMSLEYDAVFVCNGRFRHPAVPTIKGQNIFCKTQTHSRHYRVPEVYQGQTVLIIGGGTSGVELSTHISRVAKHVFLSTRTPEKATNFENTTEKPEVREFTQDSVIFNDGTVEIVDAVVHCTGYTYKCSFLTKECGVRLENNGVSPLYKQIVNIEHSSMFFIGLPYKGSGNIVYDLQVRFAMAVLTKKFILPSKEKMLKDWEESLNAKRRCNISEAHFHRLNGWQESKAYSEDLAITANIVKIPSVIFKLYKRVVECKRVDYLYKIIDDETFEETDY